MTTVSRTYNYTGASVDFTVPANVTSLYFALWGATGGATVSGASPSFFIDRNWDAASDAVANAGQGSNGCGFVAGNYATTSGTVFHIYVGGNGGNGWLASGGGGGYNGGAAGGNGGSSSYRGGGGGGATDVRVGGTALANRILVAGGAGGGTYARGSSLGAAVNPTSPKPPYGSVATTTDYEIGYYVSSGSGYGGYGGAATGGAGGNYDTQGGGGGTSSGGGLGGGGTLSGGNGGAGALGVGGAGGAPASGDLYSSGPGGGGGGYYGGGGGGGTGSSGFTGYNGGGGGGGSNYTDPAVTSPASYAHTFPPAFLGASGYGGFALLTYVQPPNAPTITAPVDGSNVPSTATLEVDLSFSHPAGTAIATYDMRYGARSSRVANSGFEVDTSGYAAITNSTIARVTTQFHGGVASMSLTATAIGDQIAGDSGTGLSGISVLGSSKINVVAWVRSAATVRSCVLEIDWYNSAGTLISTSVGTAANDSTSAWTSYTENFIAPATAAFCRRRLRVIGCAASEIHYVDDWVMNSVTAWTTNAANAASGSSAAYVYAAATFTAGLTYDIQSRATDTDGDSGPWANVTVLPVTPPGDATITAPAAGSTQSSTPFNVTWTIPSGTQQTYQVQFLDANGVVILDSGVVTSATGSYSASWTGIASQPVTFRVRYTTTTSAGQFSNYVSRAITVNLSPPGQPSVSGASDGVAGTITLTITVNDTPNTTASVHVYRQDITNGIAEIRVAASLVPSGSPRKVIWVDYTPATRTTYRYRVRANSAAGGYADF